MPYHIESDNKSCNGFAVVKDSDGEVMGCHRNEDQASRQIAALYAAEDDAEATHTMPDGSIMAGASHPRADAAAPSKDQVKGSNVNEPGSASNKSGDIIINAATETALQNKSDIHNEQMQKDDRPSWTRVSVGALRSVYRRGSGAFSTSHRPGIGRAQWSMARVNAFLYLARTGRPENPKYIGDNDLLNSDHPEYAKQNRAVSYTPTDAMVEEARRGLDWRQEFNRGGTEVGVARARDIANRRPLSHETVGRMASFFARHEVDKKGQGFTPNQDGYPSAGRIAWALWGGDPGKTFADAIMRQEQRAAGDPPAIVTDIDGTLLIGRDINTDLVQTLNNSEATILVVSAREPNQRSQTESRLAEIGLNYDELFLVGGSNATTAKVNKINELLQRFDILVAYENNETTRRAYADIGIDARNPVSNRFLVEQILARTTTIR